MADERGFVDRLITVLGYKVDDSGLKQYQSQVKTTAKTIKAMGNTARRTGQQADQSMARGFRSGVAKIKTSFKAASASVKKWRKDNEEQIKKVGEAFDKLKTRGGSLVGFFGRLAAGLAAATAGFFALLGVTNKQTAAMDAFAHAVGVSNDFLAATGEIVKPLGLGFENVADLVEEMNNKMGESKGLPEQMTAVKESLHILGLEFKTLNRLSPEDQFIKIFDAAKNLEDQQEAVSAVDMLMGGEANKILGLLRSQNTEFAKLVEHRITLNMLNQRGRRGAADFIQGMDKALIVVKSIKDQFFGLVGEGLTPLIKKFTEWATKNKALIQTKIAEYAEKTVKAIKALVKWTLILLPKISKLIDWLGGLSGVLDKVKWLLVAVASAKIIAFLVALVGWIVELKIAFVAALPAIKAIGVAISTGAAAALPFVLAIGVLIYALMDLYQWLTTGHSVIGDFGEVLGGIIYNKVQEIKQWFRDLPSQIIGYLRSAVPRVRSALSDLLPDFLMPAEAAAGRQGRAYAGTRSMGQQVSNTNTRNVRQVSQNNQITINPRTEASPQNIATEVSNTLGKLFADTASEEGV